MFFAAEDGKALYSKEKQDLGLTVAQIMHFLLQNFDEGSVNHKVIQV